MKSLAVILVLVVATVSLTAIPEAPLEVKISVSDQQQEGLNWAVKQFNAGAQRAFDAAEAQKKAAEPAYVVKKYVPITAAQYLTDRVNDLLKSYTQSAGLDDQTRLQTLFSALPKAEQDKILEAATKASEKEKKP